MGWRCVIHDWFVQLMIPVLIIHLFLPPGLIDWTDPDYVAAGKNTLFPLGLMFLICFHLYCRTLLRPR